MGTPLKVQTMLAEVVKAGCRWTNWQAISHNTYGMAIANIYASLQMGMAVFDASVAGLGGCPYAKGASGNVATEDVVYLLNGLGIDSGVDLTSLVETAVWVSAQLGRAPASNVAKAISA